MFLSAGRVNSRFSSSRRAWRSSRWRWRSQTFHLLVKWLKMPTRPRSTSPSQRHSYTLASGHRYVSTGGGRPIIFIFFIQPRSTCTYFNLFASCCSSVQDHDVECSFENTVICELGNPLRGNEKVAAVSVYFFYLFNWLVLSEHHTAFIRCPWSWSGRQLGSICTHKRSSHSCFCPRKSLKSHQDFADSKNHVLMLKPLVWKFWVEWNLKKQVKTN